MTRGRVHDDPRDDERLAMLLDARLYPQDRERLLAELAENPELIAVLAGAAQGLGSTEQSSPRLSTGSGSPRRRLFDAPVWLAAAAAIFIAVLFGVWQLAQGRTRADRVLAMVEHIDAERDLPDDWSDPSWNRARGPVVAFDHAASSVMLGARAADLAFAQRRAPNRAREIATAMRDLASGIPGSGPAVVAWESAWQGMSDSAAVPTALGDAPRGLEQLADPAYFALGATLEGLRIAILSGDSETLSSLGRELRKWTPPEESSDRVRAAIAALNDLFNQPGPTQQNDERRLQGIDQTFLAVLQGPGSV
jgi:hypothetical protein